MSLRDYISVAKPKIIPLLLLVAVGAATISTRSIPSISILAGLLVGGSLASAGALSLNSYLEVGIDAKMKRTRNRPLPSHRIVPPTNALAMGFLLLAGGLVVSFFLLGPAATFFIALGAFIYVPIYTLWLKPRTSWNIVLGGSAGSCSALAGWYSITSGNPIIGWLLAALVFVWTPSHFWSLAVNKTEDYSAAGIPMLPSVVGPSVASKYIVTNTLILIPVSLLLSPFFSGSGLLIYLVAAAVMDALLLATNIKLLRSPTPDNAWLAFKFSSPYLALIFFFAMIGALL